MKTTCLIALVVAVLICSAAAHAVTIDMVTVGNPGNAADTRYNFNVPIGSVAHVYQVGKYEVTAGQYTEFLNAVAQADPNGLYNTGMGSVPSKGAHILRTGSSPNFSYSVAADWANRPVNYVSFWDAARFANWLHNGQPTGAQGQGTTEDGAYHDVGNQTLFGRVAGAKFFIPSEDEWHKAAYHNKNAGLAPSYFDYPIGTNSSPTLDMTEATNPGNNANFYAFAYVTSYFRTIAGEFELSESPYGTFDQGGNVEEWNEGVPLGDPSLRKFRGGSFDGDMLGLHASLQSFSGPTLEIDYVGFRVASAAVPEPQGFGLAAVGLIGIAAAFLCRQRSSR